MSGCRRLLSVHVVIMYEIATLHNWYLCGQFALFFACIHLFRFRVFIQLSVAVLSPSLVPASGICYRRRLRQLSHCRHSASVSRLFSSWSPILMSYSELKHCRLLAFHSRLFVSFRDPFSFLTLPRSSSATIGFSDWLISFVCVYKVHRF